MKALPVKEVLTSGQLAARGLINIRAEFLEAYGTRCIFVRIKLLRRVVVNVISWPVWHEHHILEARCIGTGATLARMTATGASIARMYNVRTQPGTQPVISIQGPRSGYLWI
jgi:hypothetical protein